MRFESPCVTAVRRPKARFDGIFFDGNGEQNEGQATGDL
jgi:hypothetical protein